MPRAQKNGARTSSNYKLTALHLFKQDARVIPSVLTETSNNPTVAYIISIDRLLARLYMGRRRGIVVEGRINDSVVILLGIHVSKEMERKR